MIARDLRSFILSIVQPLKSGKAVSQSTTDTTATLDNLVPDGGSSDKFRMTSPFGFVSGIPKGISTFYQTLFGSRFESIILAYVHQGRPVPTTGQAILYSTDATGATVKATLTLNPDGSLTINCPGAVNVTGSQINLNTGVGIEGQVLTTVTENIIDEIYGTPTVGSSTVNAGS